MYLHLCATVGIKLQSESRLTREETCWLYKSNQLVIRALCYNYGVSYFSSSYKTPQQIKAHFILFYYHYSFNPLFVACVVEPDTRCPCRLTALQKFRPRVGTKPAGLPTMRPPFSASLYPKLGAKTSRQETHSFSTEHTNKFRLIQRAGGMHPPPPGHTHTHTHTAVTPVPLVRECGFCFPVLLKLKNNKYKKTFLALNILVVILCCWCGL